MAQEPGRETEEIGDVLRGELGSLGPVGHDTRPDSDSGVSGLLASDDPAWLSSCESEDTLRARQVQRTLAEEVAEARADRAHRFGRYVLLSELGRGGFGAVFRAWDPQLERLVAIKVLLRANSQLARDRFQREVRVTARLHHPHIAGIHDSGELNGLPFLVMDYIDGQTLEQLVNLEIRALAPSERTLRVATLMRDLSRAVAYAHKHGILHRDIKPPNVLVDQRGHAYLVDFGLARLKEGLSDLTQPGTAIGTPLFMAPEQAMGQATSKAIDVYALGATLFFALTGRPPHLAESVTDFYEKLKAGAEPASTYEPSVPPELNAICAEALETRPADRLPSAEALAALLADYVEKVPLAEAVSRQAQPLVIGLVAMAVVLLGVLLSVVSTDEPDHGHPASDDPAHAPRTEKTELSQKPPGKDDASRLRDEKEARARLERKKVEGLVEGAREDLEQGRNLQAEVKLNRALAVAPNHLDALRAMARVRFRRRDFQGCIAALTKVLARDRDKPFDWVLRGMAKSWLEKRQEAGEDFVAAIGVDPEEERAWNELSAVSRHIGTSLWRRTAERVLKSTPNNGQALFSMAFLSSQRRDWKAALHYADRLVRTGAGALAAKGLYLRGAVKLRMRDVVGARSDLQRFIKLAPKDPNAKRAQAMLNKLP